MALVYCSNCGHQISTQAPRCPGCHTAGPLAISTTQGQRSGKTRTCAYCRFKRVSDEDARYCTKCGAVFLRFGSAAFRWIKIALFAATSLVLAFLVGKWSVQPKPSEDRVAEAAKATVEPRDASDQKLGQSFWESEGMDLLPGTWISCGGHACFVSKDSALQNDRIELAKDGSCTKWENGPSGFQVGAHCKYSIDKLNSNKFQAVMFTIEFQSMAGTMLVEAELSPLLEPNFGSKHQRLLLKQGKFSQLRDSLLKTGLDFEVVSLGPPLIVFHRSGIGGAEINGTHLVDAGLA